MLNRQQTTEGRKRSRLFLKICLDSIRYLVIRDPEICRVVARINNKLVIETLSRTNITIEYWDRNLKIGDYAFISYFATPVIGDYVVVSLDGY